MDKKERKKITDKEYRDNHKGKAKEYNKEYRDNHKGKAKEYNKEYRQTPKGKKGKIISDWKQYGIIDEDLDAVYDYYIKQTECMICLKEYKNTRDRCLDHNHESGEIRYICCRNCNSNFLREN